MKNRICDTNEERKALILNECEVSCPSEAKSDIARVEIVAFLPSLRNILFYLLEGLMKECLSIL